MKDGDMFQRAAGGFGDRGVFLGGVSFGEQQGVGVEEACATQDGTDVVRVLHAVEHDERCRRLLAQAFDELGQGGGEQGEALQGEGLVGCVVFVEFVDRLLGNQRSLGEPLLCGLWGILLEEGFQGLQRRCGRQQLGAGSMGVSEGSSYGVAAVEPIGGELGRLGAGHKDMEKYGGL